MDGFLVSEVARRIRRSETWLRRAEKRGLIPRARRNSVGWRIYSSADIAKLAQTLSPR